MLAQGHALLQITHLLIMPQSRSRGVLGRGQTGGGAVEKREEGGVQFCSPPRGVPVPCICSCDTSLQSRFPACRACLMTPCWEGPLGAVRLLLRPSWFTALPLKTASTSAKAAWSTLASCCCRRITPQPSPLHDINKLSVWLLQMIALRLSQLHHNIVCCNIHCLKLVLAECCSLMPRWEGVGAQPGGGRGALGHNHTGDYLT